MIGPQFVKHHWQLICYFMSPRKQLSCPGKLMNLPPQTCDSIVKHDTTLIYDTVGIRLFLMALLTIYHHPLGLNASLSNYKLYLSRNETNWLKNKKQKQNTHARTFALKWLPFPSKASPWDEIFFQQCHQCTKSLVDLWHHSGISHLFVL